MELFKFIAPPLILTSLYEKEQFIISKLELIKLIAEPYSLEYPLTKLMLLKIILEL